MKVTDKSKIPFFAILLVVVIATLLLSGCGDVKRRCPSCGDEVSDLVECPWCETMVCESCAERSYENDDLVDFVNEVDWGDNYYTFHADNFYQEAWEEIFIPDAEYDLEEFNEFLSEYGYKLEKIE